MFEDLVNHGGCMTVKRYDVGELRSPQRLDNGWLRAEAYLTRVGVFVYRNPDGTEFREYRPPDEVFKADSLDTFALVPVTDDHPSELLTAENTIKFQKGTVEAPSQDGDKVRSRLLVTDADLVSKLQGGKVQVSCGYECELDHTPGEINGERYDAIQRNIRGNHVAIVSRGRAGSDISVRLDGACMIPQDPKQEQTMEETIKVGGIEFKVAPELAQAIRNDQAAAAKVTAERDASAEASEKLQAKLDSAQEELEKERSARKDATSPERVAELVKARVEFETRARTLLGPDADLAGRPERDVQIEALAKVSKADLSDRTDDYVSARFDAAVESAEATSAAEADLNATSTVAKADSGDSSDDARARMIKDQASAWQVDAGN